MASRSQFLGDAQQSRCWYSHRFSTQQTTGVHAKKLSRRVDQSSARESRVQHEVGTDELIDTCPSALKFTHQAAENTGACHDVSPAGARDGDENFADFQ